MVFGFKNPLRQAFPFPLRGALLGIAMLLLMVPTALAQDEAGGEDLEKAFELKATAESPRELDEVADLCESSIEKGLDPDSLASAEELLSSTLIEHADMLSQQIFASGGRDRRWRKYRRDALLRLERVIELSPNMSDAWLLQARLNTLDGGDQEVAAESLAKVLELAGEDAEQKSEAYLSLATLAAANADEDEMMENLNKALEANPDNIRAIRVRGDFHLQNGDSEKAVADYKRWLQADPDNIDAYFGVASSLAELEMNEEAVEILGKAIETKPEEIRAYIARAELNTELENYDAAIEDSTEALKLDRRSREALVARAEAYLLNSDYDEALEDTEEMLNREPGLVAAIQMRARINAAKGDFAASAEDFKTLADNDPNQIGYRLQLAQLYNADDRPRRAIAVYNSLLSDLQDGDNEALDEIRQIIYRGRGDARLARGEHEKAVADYDKAMEINDEDDGVLNNLAWVLSTSPDDDVRDGERAVELATKACEVTDYKEPHILSTLASSYAEIEDFENATKWIEEGIAVNEKRREEEEAGKNREDELERITEQNESLQEELEFYLEEKPWRVREDAEADRKKREKEEADDEDDDSEDEDPDKDADDDDEGEEDGDDGNVSFNSIAA